MISNLAIPSISEAPAYLSAAPFEAGSLDFHQYPPPIIAIHRWVMPQDSNSCAKFSALFFQKGYQMLAIELDATTNARFTADEL